MKKRQDYRLCKIVSGGAMCDRCGDRMEDTDSAFTEAVAQVADFPQRAWCTDCAPPPGELPEGIECLEAGYCPESIEADADYLGFTVEPGTCCTACGHLFEEGEWLQVGVQERIMGAEIICVECYVQLPEEGDFTDETADDAEDSEDDFEDDLKQD